MLEGSQGQYIALEKKLRGEASAIEKKYHKAKKIIKEYQQRYPNDPKFLDRYAWANSADPDQIAPRGAVWSGSTLFAIPSASFGLITLW